MVPVYIINFNWLTWPKAMTEWLVEQDVPVTIVDNGSTFGPLLAWYENCPAEVVRLKTNMGKYAPWNSQAIPTGEEVKKRYDSDFYVVTDPDLDLSSVPTNVFDVLTEIHRRYPTTTKVGLSLELDDLPELPLTPAVKAHEQQFWVKRQGAHWEAGIDTTFALYFANKRHRQVMKPSLTNGIRLDRPYTARHLPWYLDYENLTEEQKYYFLRVKNGYWSKKAKRQLRKQ